MKYTIKCEDKIAHYNETKGRLNNAPAQYKPDFEWLKEVDSVKKTSLWA